MAVAVWRMPAMGAGGDDADGRGRGGPKAQVRRGARVVVADPFLAWLMAQQVEQGLPDKAFAAKLGMSRPQWANVKRTERLLNRRWVEQICHRCARSKKAYQALCLDNFELDGAPPAED